MSMPSFGGFQCTFGNTVPNAFAEVFPVAEITVTIGFTKVKRYGIVDMENNLLHL